MKAAASETTPVATFVASDTSPVPTHFWRFFLGRNKLFFTVKSPALGTVTVAQAPFAPVPQVWYHLALIREGNVFRIQRNAEVIGTATNTLALPHVSAPIYFGQASGQGYFDGLMDEVTLYGRALSTAEVGTIYLAGNGGKCPGPVPPHIFTQPRSQTVAGGATAVLSVLASGSPPLAYQWSRNDQPLAGATNATLVLEQAQYGNANLFVNTNDAASGMAGVVLGLAPGGVLAAGSNALVNLTLSRVGTGANASTIAFGDRPVPRCVADALAAELAASYLGASITPTPAPALQCAPAGASLSLSWPVSAAAFELQTAAGGALLTGPWTQVAASRQTNAAQIVVTLPLENRTQFYRLRSP